MRLLLADVVLQARFRVRHVALQVAADHGHLMGWKVFWCFKAKKTEFKDGLKQKKNVFSTTGILRKRKGNVAPNKGVLRRKDLQRRHSRGGRSFVRQTRSANKAKSKSKTSFHGISEWCQAVWHRWNYGTKSIMRAKTSSQDSKPCTSGISEPHASIFVLNKGAIFAQRTQCIYTQQKNGPVQPFQFWGPSNVHAPR